MKILLTAKPKTGKSTVIQKFIDLYEGEKIGVIAKEIRDENSKRVGFKNVNLLGEESLFMHLTDIDSDVIIGGDWKVDVSAIDKFVVPEINKDSSDDSILIIDEIGRAQAESALFLKTIRDIFSTDKNLLASIVYDDDEWAREFKQSAGVIIIEVTEQNRDALPEIIVEMFKKKISITD